ncbi:MAG: IS1 family transposase [Cyanobacteriota bacterium]
MSNFDTNSNFTLTLHTRIKRLDRETICFSSSVVIPNTGIGLFINCYEFEIGV